MSHSWLTVSKNERMSASSIQFTFVLVIPTKSASIATCVPRPGRNPYENPRKSSWSDRAQHRSRGPLDDLVLKGGDRDRALPTIRLGYVNPPRRSCPIRSPMDASIQILEIALKVLLVVPTCQPINPRCSILLEFKECLCEVINTDVMEARGEPLLLPLPCSLP